MQRMVYKSNWESYGVSLLSLSSPFLCFENFWKALIPEPKLEIFKSSSNFPIEGSCDGHMMSIYNSCVMVIAFMMLFFVCLFSLTRTL